MVIQNAVGGWVKIDELGIKLGPRQIVDLDFYCSRKQQEASKELKRAISRRFVKEVQGAEVGQKWRFSESSIGEHAPSVARSGADALRRAVFLSTDIPENPPYDLFAMRDVQSKLAMVKAASSPKFLGTVVQRDQDGHVVRAAHKRLQDLVG